MLWKIIRFIVNSREPMVKDILLCLLSAALLIFSFPKPGIWIFAWFGFIPLFVALKNKTKLKSFILAGFTGLVFWWGVIYWLCHVTALGTVILIFYLSLYFGLFGLCIYFSNNSKLPTPYSLFFLPSAWVALEYSRSYLLTGFPWAILGYSQYLNTDFVQFVDITGAWGASFLLILINIILLLIFSKDLKREKKLLLSVFLTLLIFLVYNYGWWRLNSLKGAKKIGEIKIASLQGNIPQEMKWDYGSRKVIIDKYLDLTKMAILDGAKLIVWPEASLPIVPEENPLEFGLVSEVCRKSKVPVLLGAVTSKDELYFNSALLISSQGEVAAQYDKTHLVPFGEYIPLRKALPFLETIVPIGDVSAGKKDLVFYLDHRKTGVRYEFSSLICFEDVFPDISRKFVKKGAEFLVNMTNDAWYKKTSAPYQHMQASIFRAMENRVYLVRSANTGVTCFISPQGDIISKVVDAGNNDIFIEGFISEKIPILDTRKTFYTKYGDIFAVSCFLFSALFLVIRRKNV